MDIIQDCLTQTAVYWPPDAPISGGRYTYLSPVPIACRWDDETAVISDPTGRAVGSRAEVMVDRDVKRFGRLYRVGHPDTDPDYNARLAAALAAGTDPNADALNGEAWEVIRFCRTPTLDGDEVVRTAYL